MNSRRIGLLYASCGLVLGLVVLASLSAGVGNVEGVSRFFVYENDTDSTDANGIPAHSIAAVVAGGDAQEIGEQIALRKSPGIQTFGDVDVTVVSPVWFSRPCT